MSTIVATGAGAGGQEPGRPVAGRCRHRSRAVPVITAALVAGLIVSGCGSAGARHGATTTSSPAPAAPASAAASAAAPASTAPPVTRSATVAARGPDFSTIAGSYVAGTADGGWLYIRSDGASRLKLPDPVACPTCSTATAPIATLDFSLRTLRPSTPGGYVATGRITAESDPAAAPPGAGGIGSPVTVTVASGGA